MLSAYAAAAVLGMAVSRLGRPATWLGWTGVGWGLAFAAGLVATRFAGPFNPPFSAHLDTGTRSASTSSSAEPRNRGVRRHAGRVVVAVKDYPNYVVARRFGYGAVPRALRRRGEAAGGTRCGCGNRLSGPLVVHRL